MRQRRAGDHGEVEAGRSTRDAGGGRRARPRIEADLDDIDAPIEDLGQGDRTRAESPTGVVGGECQLDEQLGERAGGRPPFRRRSEQHLAGACRDVAERRQLLAHPAGQHDRQVAAAAGSSGHQRGELPERTPLIGRRRIARTHQDARDGTVEKHRGHRERVDRLRTACDGPPATP
jgi:hypothetical protein